MQITLSLHIYEFVLLDKNNVENSQVIVMYEDSSFGHVLVPHKDEFLDTLEWDYSMDEYLFEKLEIKENIAPENNENRELLKERCDFL